MRPHEASPLVLPAALALAAAMLLGGSGSLVPRPEIILQCLLAALTGLWVWLRPHGLRQVPRGAWVIAGLAVALPLWQLLPLPAVIWHHLQGRSIEQAALELVGQGQSWRPVSQTIDRTVASLLVMAAAAAMLVMAAAQDRRGRTILLATVAAIALLSVLVGAAQLSGGAGNGFRFYNPDEAFLDGFQTNHNAQADVLLFGMVALAAAAADWAGQDRGDHRSAAPDPRMLLAWVGGASLLLILGVLLTASRTGIALLPVAITAQMAILWGPLRRALGLGRRPDKRIVAVVALAIAAVAVLVITVLVAHSGALATVWARFHNQAELRPEIWRDSWFALQQYWPWGTGMGSFVPVFAAAERLEVVGSHFVNRAHDDYLEFLIEAGLPGVLIFWAIYQQLAKGAWQSWRARHNRLDTGSTAQWLCGAANLVIVAIHSLGDYPLRTMAIACITAVSAGVLLPVSERPEPGNVK